MGLPVPGLLEKNRGDPRSLEQKAGIQSIFDKAGNISLKKNIGLGFK